MIFKHCSHKQSIRQDNAKYSIKKLALDKTIALSKSKKQPLWILKMAWRDSRKSKGKLLLFILAISLGIAAQVGISSFRENLIQEINNQAKELLGADIEITGNQPLPDSLLLSLFQLAPEMSRETYFASMVYFPQSDGTRLAQIRALSGKYPYYGNIETFPAEAADKFQSGKYALVDEKLMLQYNVEIGDRVNVGSQTFEVLGKLRGIPGQSNVGAIAAPVVYIPYNYLDHTDLVKKGSRINYAHYFQFSPEVDTTGRWAALIDQVDQAGFEVDDIENRKQETGEAFNDLTNFLELVAFAALLLGAIGVASAMFVYTREKISTVATLRCLGMKSNQAISIFLVQVAIFGFIGSVLGSLIGVLLHLYLPVLVEDFVPVDINPTLSWVSVMSGVGIGVIISILFASFSLLSLRKITPLQAIRNGIQQEKSPFDVWKVVIGVLIVLFFYLLIYIQIGSWLDSLVFTGSLALIVGILALSGKGFTWLIRRFMPRSISYVWRQGLSNLYRPNNQTSLLITTLGLGTAFIATLLFMQDLLVDRVTIAGSGERPNTILFDIQTPQKEEVKQLVADYDLPVMQEVPIVTMRLVSLNGINQKQAAEDTANHQPDWLYNREYRVTFRDHLIDSEKIVEGDWTGKANPGDSIFISISSGIAERLHLQLGDEMLFNVQGALLKTYIGSFREVDWRRVQTNFLVVFPEGVLERAPQFHVLITKIDETELSAMFQQSIVRQFPNVSIIDLELILDTLEEILGKIAFVIRFMAFFSIGTGFIMLIGSIVLSRFQRIQENVLLRTLGANSQQLWKIIFAEYFFLGMLGSLVGLLIAVISSVLLGRFVFDMTYVPDFLGMIIIALAITFTTVVIGLLNNREVVRQSPLAVLRNEL
jgi:putative ABC transport system permease protein